MPSANTLFNSTKRVFAHYFYPFPVSIDNAAPANDYYNSQYLNAGGESGKWQKQGGYLRQRPLPVAPSTSPNWQQLNMESEVRAAIARGITGFTFDSMSASDATDSSSALHLMLAAAQAVDSRFKIVVMPDLRTLGATPSSVVQIITAAAASPAAIQTQRWTSGGFGIRRGLEFRRMVAVRDRELKLPGHPSRLCADVLGLAQHPRRVRRLFIWLRRLGRGHGPGGAGDAKRSQRHSQDDNKIS